MVIKAVFFDVDLLDNLASLFILTFYNALRTESSRLLIQLANAPNKSSESATRSIPMISRFTLTVSFFRSSGKAS